MHFGPLRCGRYGALAPAKDRGVVNPPSPSEPVRKPTLHIEACRSLHKPLHIHMRVRYNNETKVPYNVGISFFFTLRTRSYTHLVNISMFDTNHSDRSIRSTNSVCASSIWTGFHVHLPSFLYRQYSFISNTHNMCNHI
jgi:hypothetical protein